MHLTLRHCVLLLAAVGALPAADPNCPGYPSAVRTELEESLSLDREFQSYSRLARARSSATARRSQLAESQNVIDQLIWTKMSADGVESAPRTSDAEFLRRI